MHIFFSGIGGTAIGPLALIAHQAGYTVSGSDKQSSQYIEYLQDQGITAITIGQSKADITELHARKPIDWIVYSSAIEKENHRHPELTFAKKHGIKTTKRDQLLNEIIKSHHLKLVAIAGTHGKTTTTAMMIWLLQNLGIPVSYSVGAKISFGEMGHFDPNSEYFVYECDEYDRNFLSFHPFASIITGIAWDHPDVFPTRKDYESAFKEFIDQSHRVVLWKSDADKLKVGESADTAVLDDENPATTSLTLPGAVNRDNAWEAIAALQFLQHTEYAEAIEIMNRFPGVSRRFEQIAPGLYTDYAHTPEKIQGALQLAQEVGNGNVVVVYEGLHNTRQHFIKNELKTLFNEVKQLYVVPSYLAREDESLKLLAPHDIIKLTRHSNAKSHELDADLRTDIERHLAKEDLVLCLSAGGGGSLDEWLRQQFKHER